MKFQKILLFILVGSISLSLGYKTKQIISPTKIAPNNENEIVIEMEALPAPSPQRSGISTDQSIYESHCAACHDTGAAGAPKLGDTLTWTPRIKKGTSVLLEHVITGYNLMPPKGTCLECSNADLEAATKYLLKKSNR